ncbi:hypothetical protein ACLB2K_052518 [Fragaria x ananassa]
MLGAVASVPDVGLSVVLCGISPLGEFPRRRVALAGELLQDPHSLDIREEFAGVVLPGMTSDDRVIVPYSRFDQVFWLYTNKSPSPQSERALGWGVIL